VTKKRKQNEGSRSFKYQTKQTVIESLEGFSKTFCQKKYLLLVIRKFLKTPLFSSKASQDLI
jgi:hypothetical protein